MRINRIKQQEMITDEDDCDLMLMEPLMNKFKGKKGAIIPLLQGAQNIYGYVPKGAFYKISEGTGLKLSDLYGVATFYAQFRLKPVGKIIIKVCHGTACHVQNANAITEAIVETLGVKDGETTEDRLFTLESVACLGCCSLAPVMMIGEDTYGKLTGDKAVKIIRNIKINETK